MRRTLWRYRKARRETSRSLSALWPKLCPECLPSVCLDVSAADFCSGLILTMDKWRLIFEEYCVRKVMETAEMLKKNPHKFGCRLEVFYFVEIRANMLKVGLIKQHRQCSLHWQWQLTAE